MTIKHGGLIALALALGSMFLYTLQVSTSDGATAARGRLQVIRKDDDAFRNYDFTEQTVSRNKVDWPVNFVYYNRAEIDKVKDKMKGFMPFRGSSMNGRVDDGSGPVWDTDRGIKDRRCPNPAFGSTAYHTRLYAPPNTDYMYNRSWGFYIIGTSHIDHNECWPRDRWYGRTEDAEGRITLYARDVFGPSRVHRDHVWFRNDEPFRREGNHIWKNNGYATFVNVP